MPPSPTRPLTSAAPRTPRDTLICLFLDVAIVPFFAYLLLACLFWGPDQFFGEFDRHDGVVAIELAGLIVVAAICWALFFISYRRAGVVATALGCLVCGAASFLALVLAYDKFTRLDARPSTHPHDRLPTHDADLLVLPALFALVALAGAIAMRWPRVRLAFAAPAALAAVGGLIWLCRDLAAGDFNPYRLAVIGCPLATGLALLAALFPYGTPFPRRRPPR